MLRGGDGIGGIGGNGRCPVLLLENCTGSLMLAAHLHPANPEWAQARTAGLPGRWRKRLFNAWKQRRDDFDPLNPGTEGEATRGAARWLYGALDRLREVRIPLDATDADVCARAEQMAAHCGELGQVFRESSTLRAAMERACTANHVEPPKGKSKKQPMPDGPAIARMVDPLWWRRQLRKVHAKAVEGSAITMGYVNKTRDIYVSNESLRRRQQQNKRNAAMLESTVAKNDQGQEYTLAELAAKGTANKAIRRGELMTRIAGFEHIAVECGHVGLFFTMTCPSRMHKWRTVAGGKVIENPKYDGTTPREAQKYLSHVWALIRARLKRYGIAMYGFRIAEPNHDGTPHWHFLVFFPESAEQDIREVVRGYALADSPNEKGAAEHRVDFKKMEAGKGTAAGYIAKYVAKNIDGCGVEKDLFGNDAMTASRRVEAWAATWGIRQFQQVGGPPVTVWRELRRVKELPEDAPEHLRVAHSAVNKVAQIEGGDKRVSWARYCKAQGGVFCGRRYEIKLAQEPQDGTNRYGEARPARPVGVETHGTKTIRDGICVYEVTARWLVRSVRYVWEIVRRRSSEAHAGIARAWTCVNNCTRETFADVAERMAAWSPGPGKPADFEFVGPLNVPELEKGLA